MSGIYRADVNDSGPAVIQHCLASHVLRERSEEACACNMHLAKPPRYLWSTLGLSFSLSMHVLCKIYDHSALKRTNKRTNESMDVWINIVYIHDNMYGYSLVNVINHTVVMQAYILLAHMYHNTVWLSHQTRLTPNVGLMLVQRRRRWANIKPTLV